MAQDDLVKEALELLKKDVDAWNEIYAKAREDLLFLSDDPAAQWDEIYYNQRKSTGRPTLTINQLSQFIHQVENDIRMNTPTIDVIPSDDESTIEVAQVIKGLIKSIEYKSNADDAYDMAASFAVRCGIGFIRVDHDYIDPDSDSLNQDFKICRIVNPFAVVIDSNSVEAAGADIKHAFIQERISVKEFESLYPDKDPISFEEVPAGQTPKVCKGAETLNIVEFFKIEEQKTEITLDGRKKIKKTRIVKRYKLSGNDILEEGVFPGKYIPIVPVYGEEAWRDGRRSLNSLIRFSKDAQRMFNHWKSLETELLMKSPNAPILAVEGTTEDFKEDYANPQKAVVLRYKQTDSQGNPAPRPERLEPPTIPTGVVNASRGAVDDIKATMGIYNASLGQRSNEQSGIAIARRQQEGDVATFHFGDNLVKAINQVGRVIVSGLKEVYDTPRLVKSVSEEEEIKTIGINGLMVEGQSETANLTKGSYDVRVVTGAPFATKRQEAAKFYESVVSRQPDLMKVMGDLLFKNMDMAGAQAMASRMKKIIPPELLQEDGEEVDPQVVQLQAQLQEAQIIMQQMQQQIEVGAQELQSKQMDLQVKAQAEQLRADNDKAKNEIEVLKLQIQERESMTENEIKAAELQIKQKELELKERDLEFRAMQARLDAKISVSGDVAMTDVDMNGGVSPLLVMADTIRANSEQTNQALMTMAQLQQSSTQNIVEAISRPKALNVKRDSTGKIQSAVVQ